MLRRRSSIRSCSAMEVRSALSQRRERRRPLGPRLWIRSRLRLGLLRKEKKAEKDLEDSTDTLQWRKRKR